MPRIGFLTIRLSCLVFMAIFLIFSTTACAVLPVPKLISPVSGSTNISLETQLKWQVDTDWHVFELVVAKQTGNRERLVLERQVEGTSFQIPEGILEGLASYTWRARVAAPTGEKGDWSVVWHFSTQTANGSPYEDIGKEDTDKDGIPDTIEMEIYRTDPLKKTLFVRPKKEVVDHNGRTIDVYWSEFCTHLFPESSGGIARIPAFVDANIEVVVLGAPNHPYSEFRGNSSTGEPGVRYDPHNHPEYPIDILEIVLKKTGSEEWPVYLLDADDSVHKGHTYFLEAGYQVGDGKMAYQWVWSTKGFTSGSPQDRYFKAYLYLYPLERYFEEGAYKVIGENAVPEILNCKEDPSKCIQASPMNLNDQDPLPDPPFTLRADGNTVEFNAIAFDANGTITGVQASDKRFDKYQVMARTAVHEMGHALLTATNLGDHCENPCCILYGGTITDWKQRLFGPPCDVPQDDGSVKTIRCRHSPGGSQDIRGDGYIKNEKPH